MTRRERLERKLELRREWAEKREAKAAPDRDILDALKASGFRWGAGSWHGQREKLPATLIEQVA